MPSLEEQYIKERDRKLDEFLKKEGGFDEVIAATDVGIDGLKRHKIECLAKQLHDWYLEATDIEDSEYNYKAVVPYDDLTDGQKMIDRHIAGKVAELLSSRDQQWREAVESINIEKVTDYGRNISNPDGKQIVAYQSVAGYNLAVDELNRQKAKILSDMADQSKGVKG
jgi:hypothetical protein